MMNQKSIKFPLTSPTRLIPVTGRTMVQILTSGEVLVSVAEKNTANQPRRVRSVKLASTRYGRFASSPKGHTFSVKITLPASLASESEFQRQVKLLYEELRLGAI